MTTTTSQTPPFSGFNVTDFPTIDLAQLEKGSREEVSRLMEACQDGFFYLDFRQSVCGSAVLEQLPQIYSLTDEYFRQGKEAKIQDTRLDQKPWQDKGYKQSFCDETFEISIDELRSGGDRLPPQLSKELTTIRVFSENCHAACTQMLASLSDGLELQQNSRLEKHHQPEQPSNSGLKLIYEPTLAELAKVQDNLHTDSGTFTLLFYDKWGLEAHSHKRDSWGFTAGKEGCALINVADSLERLSRGCFHSPQHRVSQTQDGAEDRYYLSYFLRPQESTRQALQAL